jgi:GNAT superfamily N-acetyltransferase
MSLEFCRISETQWVITGPIGALVDPREGTVLHVPGGYLSLGPQCENESLLMMPVQQESYTRSSATTIRRISASSLKHVITDLIDAFTDTVNGGSPLGFLPPITRDEARDYWISLLPELQAGSRLLLVASIGDRVVGSGQLALSQRTNSPHRAELQRLFVARTVRGQGVGRSLMHALHDVARQNGRTLISLSTRRGEPAEEFYKGLGYVEAGVIPGWTIGPAGERFDHVTLYQELDRA